MEKSFTIELHGFYREEFLENLTALPGVYFVFLGYKTDRGCSIKKCIYIGKAEAQGVRDRLKNHDKMAEFHKKQASSGGMILYFAYAECPVADVAEIEGSLIKHFQPEINVECIESFKSKADTILLSLGGKIPVIFANDQQFVVVPEKEFK